MRIGDALRVEISKGCVVGSCVGEKIGHDISLEDCMGVEKRGG